MSLPAFLTESPATSFIQSADNSVVLPDEQKDEYEAIERRLERVRHCMAVHNVFDPHTGIPRQRHIACHVWRLCPPCARYRKSKLKERVERAMDSGPVRRLDFEADDPDAKKVVRKYHKDSVIRFPHLDDDGGICETLFIATSDDIGVIVDEAEMKRTPWTRLVNTPEGKKISGQLGALVKSEAGDVVQQTSFVIDGLDDKQMEQAQQAAIRQTIDLDPKTLEDLQKAMSRRERAYARQVVKLGGTIIFSQVTRVSVDKSHIAWKMTLPQSIRLVREANLKLPSSQMPRYRDLPPEYQRIIDREEWLQ